MAVAGIYIVAHVERGFLSSCIPYDDIGEARRAFEKAKDEFTFQDDHLQLLDGFGLLMDEAGEVDDHLPEDVSICVGCNKRTNDGEVQNPTKWDEYGDPYCVGCFAELDAPDDAKAVSLPLTVSEIYKAFTEDF